jgi:hypothetical protein
VAQSGFQRSCARVPMPRHSCRTGADSRFALSCVLLPPIRRPIWTLTLKRQTARASCPFPGFCIQIARNSRVKLPSAALARIDQNCDSNVEPDQRITIYELTRCGRRASNLSWSVLRENWRPGSRRMANVLQTFSSRRF